MLAGFNASCRYIDLILNRTVDGKGIGILYILRIASCLVPAADEVLTNAAAAATLLFGHSRALDTSVASLHHR